MKRTDFRTLAWLPCLGLLAQTLAACSASDAPLAPSTDDDATIQKVEVIDDGTGDGVAEPPQDEDRRDEQDNPSGKNPATPDGD